MNKTYKKCVSVIESCETFDQLIVASKFLYLTAPYIDHETFEHLRNVWAAKVRSIDESYQSEQTA